MRYKKTSVDPSLWESIDAKGSTFPLPGTTWSMICTKENSIMSPFNQYTPKIQQFYFFTIRIWCQGHNEHKFEGESNFPTVLQYGINLHTIYHT